MNIKDLIEALNENTFHADMIDDPFVFLQLHKGETLVEHIARHSDAINLLENTLLRYAALIGQPPHNGITHRDILYQYLLFFCEVIAASQHEKTADYILNILPKLYELHVAHPKNTSISALSPNYFDFLPQTHPIFPFLSESPLIHRLRYICLSQDIGNDVKECEFLRDIDTHSLKIKLTDMMHHSLYASMQDEQTYEARWSEIGKSIGSYIGLTLPMTQTHTSFQLSSYIDVLAHLNNPSCAALSTQQKLSKIELLTLLYREGSDELQSDIASHMDAMLQANPTDQLLHQMLLITITPAPLGRALPKFRENSPALLSRLPLNTVQSLLKAIPPLLSNDEEKLRFDNKLSIMGTQTMTFDYEPSMFIKVSPKLTESSLWLAHITSLTEIVHDMRILSLVTEGNDRRFMLSMMGSDKLILVFNSFADAGALISDYDYYQIFSPRKPRFQLEIEDHSYFYSVRNLLGKSLKYGIRNIRIHDDHLEKGFRDHFDHHKPMLDDEPLSLQFTKPFFPPCDITITQFSILPGKLSSSSNEAMLHFATVLSHYGSEIINIHHSNTDLSQFQLSPMLCEPDYMVDFIQMIQDELSKNEHQERYVWAICKTFKQRLEPTECYYYDLHIYKDRLALGPLSKLNIYNPKMMHHDIKKKVQFNCPSLFVMSAQKFLKLPNRPDVSEKMKDELKEVEKFGVKMNDNPFRFI